MRRLEHLWWPALQAAAQQPGSTVVLPVGAFEQHGPHLPMGTDLLFAEAVLDRVLDRLPAELPLWRLPAVAFGFSPEHLGFPGTVSLSAEALLAQLQGIAAALSEAGFRRLVLFNGHGGQIALLQVAARQLQQQFPSLAVLPQSESATPRRRKHAATEVAAEAGAHAGASPLVPPALRLAALSPPTAHGAHGVTPAALSPVALSPAEGRPTPARTQARKLACILAARDWELLHRCVLFIQLECAEQLARAIAIPLHVECSEHLVRVKGRQHLASHLLTSQEHVGRATGAADRGGG